MRTGVVWMEDGMSTLVDLLPHLKREYEELVLCGREGTQYRLLAAVRKNIQNRLWIGTNTRYPDVPITSLSVFIAAKRT